MTAADYEARAERLLTRNQLWWDYVHYMHAIGQGAEVSVGDLARRVRADAWPPADEAAA